MSVGFLRLLSFEQVGDFIPSIRRGQQEADVLKSDDEQNSRLADQHTAGLPLIDERVEEENVHHWTCADGFRGPQPPEK